ALEPRHPPLGADSCRDPRTGVAGVLLRVLDAYGGELYAEHRLSGAQLEPTLVRGAHTVEISALLRPTTSGEWTFSVAGFGRMSLTVDGRTLVEGEYAKQTDDPAVVHVRPPRQYGHIELAAHRDVLVVARRELAPDTGRAVVVTAAPPSPD
ncbi:glycosyl hydrolase, partial [Streptomyces sp. T-3]|nr:glycosyl hydrolase [Streptomyces sp. T-3]